MADASSKSNEKPKMAMAIIPDLICTDTMKTNTCSSSSSSSIPTSPVGFTKADHKRSNCLCSPTTHVGSFRCRHHRKSRGIKGSMSVGSKLSDLDHDKANAINMPHNMLFTAADNSRGSTSSTFLPV